MLQAAGGIDDDHVGAGGQATVDRAERDGPRIGVRRTGDDLAAGALAPHLELLDGRSAERVGRGEHDLQAEGGAQVVTELAGARGLARAVHADHEDHARRGAQIDVAGLLRADGGAGGEEAGELVGELLARGTAASDLLEARDDPGGGGRADVGADQRLLQPLPRLGIERVEERGAHLGAQCLARAAEALTEALEEAAALLGSTGAGAAAPSGRRTRSFQSRAMAACDDTSSPPEAPPR